ncbi:hypothetical protein [Nocardia sp. NPDC050710]|uniref:hypothetical protein n=1 Tax=Nocardia sp. NPDC050710 TaxID=3157220 RepID=UPI0033E65B8C
MGYQRRSTSQLTWLTWDNYLVGVLGLIIAAALGTVAATIALSGHYAAAITLATVALAFAIPAALQVIGELLAGLLLIGMLVCAALLLPAILVSPSTRRWAKRRWTTAWR